MKKLIYLIVGAVKFGLLLGIIFVAAANADNSTIVIPLFENDIVPSDNIIYVADEIEEILRVGRGREFETIEAALETVDTVNDAFTIVLDAGEHQLTEPLELLNFGQSVVGLGQENTVLTSVIGDEISNFDCSDASVRLGEGTSLSNLTLRVTPPPGNSAVGICIIGQVPRIRDMKIEMQGDNDLTGLKSFAGTTLFSQINGVAVKITNTANTSKSVGLDLKLQADLSNIQVNVTGGAEAIGLDIETLGGIEVRDSRIASESGSETQNVVGFRLFGAAEPDELFAVTIERSEIVASRGSNSIASVIGLLGDFNQPEVNIRRSTVNSDDIAVAEEFSPNQLTDNYFFSQSVVQGITNLGRQVCVFSTDLSLTPLRRNCSPISP